MKTPISFMGGGGFEVQASLEDTRKMLAGSDAWVKLPGPKGDMYVRQEAVSHIGPERQEHSTAQFR